MAIILMEFQVALIMKFFKAIVNFTQIKIPA